MSKRDPASDVPRRIYRSTIDRIEKHIKFEKVENGNRKKVKKDFNKFLELLIDTYETLQTAPLYYTNELFDDVESARGSAILKATKAKIPLNKIQEPKAVMVME